MSKQQCFVFGDGLDDSDSSQQKMRRIIKDQYVNPRGQQSNGISRVTFAQRKLLEELLKRIPRPPIKEIAKATGLSRSTIFFERQRMGSAKERYCANTAQQDADKKRVLDSYRRNNIPIRYKYELSKLLKIIEEIEKISTPKQRDLIENAKYVVKNLGVNEEKIKRPLTIAECKLIASMWSEGKTINAIAMTLKRARSTVHTFIHKNNLKKNDQTNKEFKDELIRSKWLNETDQ